MFVVNKHGLAFIGLCISKFNWWLKIETKNRKITVILNCHKLTRFLQGKLIFVIIY